MIRFALNFKRKLIILVDLTNFTTEQNGLYVNYYDYYVTITWVVYTLLREFATPSTFTHF